MPPPVPPSVKLGRMIDGKPVRSSTALGAYVPDGMTAAQWEAVKKKEKAAKAKKNFGVGGARGFKSRSMASWQEAYERGETGHLMPVDPAKVKRGEIALKDVPYMQRGGSWDNEDLVRGGGRFGGKFGGRKGWEKTGFGGITGYNDGKAAPRSNPRSPRRPRRSIFGRVRDGRPGTVARSSPGGCKG